MDKLTKKDQTRLRQCEVVIWRLLHEKAALDYSNYSTAWQSWFDDRVSEKDSNHGCEVGNRSFSRCINVTSFSML